MDTIDNVHIGHNGHNRRPMDTINTLDTLDTQWTQWESNGHSGHNGHDVHSGHNVTAVLGSSNRDRSLVYSGNLIMMFIYNIRLSSHMAWNQLTFGSSSATMELDVTVVLFVYFLIKAFGYNKLSNTLRGKIMAAEIWWVLKNSATISPAKFLPPL